MVWEKKDTSDGEVKGAWNAAQDTLKRLSEVIKLYRELSIGIINSNMFNPETPENQKRMYRTAKMFMVEAAPLLSNDQDKEAVEAFKQINLKLVKGSEGRYNLSYAPEVTAKLDSFLMLIQNFLQEKGYFMPDADDEGLF